VSVPFSLYVYLSVSGRLSAVGPDRGRGFGRGRSRGRLHPGCWDLMFGSDQMEHEGMQGWGGWD
jgi:hypothetical protein